MNQGVVCVVGLFVLIFILIMFLLYFFGGTWYAY